MRQPRKTPLRSNVPFVRLRYDTVYVHQLRDHLDPTRKTKTPWCYFVYFVDRVLCGPKNDPRITRSVTKVLKSTFKAKPMFSITPRRNLLG